MGLHSWLCVDIIVILEEIPHTCFGGVNPKQHLHRTCNRMFDSSVLCVSFLDEAGPRLNHILPIALARGVILRGGPGDSPRVVGERLQTENMAWLFTIQNWEPTF